MRRPSEFSQRVCDARSWPEIVVGGGFTRRFGFAIMTLDGAGT